MKGKIGGNGEKISRGYTRMCNQENGGVLIATEETLPVW